MNQFIKIIILGIIIASNLVFAAMAEQNTTYNRPERKRFEQLHHEMESLRRQIEPIQLEMKQLMQRMMNLRKELQPLESRMRADQEQMRSMMSEHKH